MAKKSFWGRSSRLVGLASKLAAQEIGMLAKKSLQSEKARELTEKLTRIKQATAITEDLAKLKGAAMKAGQLLSIDTSEYIPEEARQILSQLQSMAEPYKYDEIKEILETELGDKLNKLEDFEETAFAAASIGQVHRAKYKGQKIVLKIQYPGVRENIDTDIELLEKIIRIGLKSTFKNIDTKEAFEELRRVLTLESDYKHEAKVLAQIHARLKDHPFFSAPNTVPELCSERVLAMQFCEGELLSAFIKTNKDKRQSQKLGQEFLNLFLLEFLSWNQVQTDPNFGNYLVQKDPFKLVLLDFGSTLNYSPEFVKEYLSLIFTAARGDLNETFNKAIDFNLLDSRESVEVQTHFLEMMQLSMEPFLSKQQPFEFNDVDYERRLRKKIFAFTNSLKFSPPPRKILFLHRKLGGLFNLIRQLNVKIDMRPYWEELRTYSEKSESTHVN